MWANLVEIVQIQVLIQTMTASPTFALFCPMLPYYKSAVDCSLNDYHTTVLTPYSKIAVLVSLVGIHPGNSSVQSGN